MAACKILLCGDVRGQFDHLFRRVCSVNKANGPFDALLCVGQFFPDDQSHIDKVMRLVEGDYEIPIPMYFIGDYGQTADEALSAAKLKAKDIGLVYEGIPVCENLYWLKGSGILYLKGLRVAFLAGKYVASVYHSASGAQSHGAFHEDDVDALRAYAEESNLNDLFLSNEWPQGVLNGVEAPLGLDFPNNGSPVVAEIVAELKPRYHIAGSEGLFYARDPYRNKENSHVTRFVGLGAVGNAKKQKFLHALSLTPAACMDVKELTQQPLNTTKSPYATPSSTATSKDLLNFRPPAQVSDGEAQYWRYSTPNNNLQKTTGGVGKVCFEFMVKGSCSRGNTCDFKHERNTEKPMLKGACFDFVTKGKCSRGSDCKFRHNLDEDRADTGELASRSSMPCWFCLASPNFDTHLVVDVGDHCYCALPKGGVVDGHVLLVPIEHVSSMLLLPKAALEELNKYKRILQKLYKSQGKTFAIFERCIQFKGGTHAHLQAVPIPVSKSSEVRSGFLLAAKELGFVFDAIHPEKDDVSTEQAVKSHVGDQTNYFVVELSEGTILVHVPGPAENIPTQFGREVCAKVLGVPERSDWRACRLSKEEETSLAEKLKKELSTIKR